MSANTETTGAPPKGYFRCPQKCGRWTAWAYEEKDLSRCNHCAADGDVALLADMDSAIGPDWTPPIAAPAAHVERRKGQRWRFEYRATAVAPGIVRTFALVAPGESIGNQGWNTDDRHGFVANNAWDDTAHFTMTLIADATPEPGSPFCCDLTAFGPGGCNCKSPPAQEAPKAAPVCCVEGQEIACGGSLLRRIIGHDIPPILICDAHWMLRESRMIEGAKAPYAGPERLRRPQLAADWIEDCLEDAR